MDIREALRIGPRRPEPLPSGKAFRLLTCPRCQQKGLVFFHAPHERGYPSKCLKCGVHAVFKNRETSLHELQATGGFTPLRPGLRQLEVRQVDGGPSLTAYDATKLYREVRDRQSMGWRRAQARGFNPNLMAEPPKSSKATGR